MYLRRHLQNQNFVDNDKELLEGITGNLVYGYASAIYENEEQISKNRVEFHYDGKGIFLFNTLPYKIKEMWDSKSEDQIMLIVVDREEGLRKYIQVFQKI